MTFKEKEPIVPINIWNNIERCWVERLDIVYEGSTIVGIHHTEWEDAIYEIDRLCKKLQAYKNELIVAYKINDKLVTSSISFSYIYILKCQRTSLYKIGRSINPIFREKTIQSEAPDIVNIFTSPLTSKKTEKELHRIFKTKRVRGEWFDLSENDILFIKNYDYGVA